MYLNIFLASVQSEIQPPTSTWLKIPRTLARGARHRWRDLDTSFHSLKWGLCFHYLGFELHETLKPSFTWPTQQMWQLIIISQRLATDFLGRRKQRSVSLREEIFKMYLTSRFTQPTAAWTCFVTPFICFFGGLDMKSARGTWPLWHLSAKRENLFQKYTQDWLQTLTALPWAKYRHIWDSSAPPTNHFFVTSQILGHTWPDRTRVSPRSP